MPGLKLTDKVQAGYEFSVHVISLPHDFGNRLRRAGTI
jgi:hypothetical protein